MLALLGGLLAWGLVWRGRQRAGLALALLCLGGLWAVSTPWVAWALALPLESRHPPVPAAASPVADAVLVLGGALQARAPAGSHTWALARPPTACGTPPRFTAQARRAGCC
jgi:uncharacterized SAM-binding protein YcdF (DUF218 family)